MLPPRPRRRRARDRWRQSSSTASFTNADGAPRAISRAAEASAAERVRVRAGVGGSCRRTPHGRHGSCGPRVCGALRGRDRLCALAARRCRLFTPMAGSVGGGCHVGRDDPSSTGRPIWSPTFSISGLVLDPWVERRVWPARRQVGWLWKCQRTASRRRNPVSGRESSQRGVWARIVPECETIRADRTVGRIAPRWRRGTVTELLREWFRPSGAASRRVASIVRANVVPNTTQALTRRWPGRLPWNGRRTMVQPPGRAGLYDPRFEHDSCGVSFVANIKGVASRRARAHRPAAPRATSSTAAPPAPRPTPATAPAS